MKTKTKWITGVVLLCLITAAAASVFTAAFLLRGLFGYAWLRLLPQSIALQTTGKSSQGLTDGTSSALAATPTPKPTATPTPSPTPAPTPTPSPLPTPMAGYPEQNAMESLYLWQTRDLIERIYENVAPSVVGIRVTVTGSGSSTTRTNEGSGLIISEKGTIVTNASILSIAFDNQGKLNDLATIQVYVKDQPQPFLAQLTGKDPVTGLAVLAITPGAAALKAADMAKMPALKVGQMVLVIGYPDDLDQAGGLASGLISGLNRPVVLENGTTVQMIQTNVEIGQSCSGGPLLDLQGKVIGLSNCGLARESYDTVNYALPVDTLLAVAQSLSDQGYVSGRSWLGVTVLTETSFTELKTLYHFPDGLYISTVVNNSPAYTADLRKGDVIVQINDEAVSSSTDLSSFLQTKPVGTLLKIKIYRQSDNQTHDLQVCLQEYKR